MPVKPFQLTQQVVDVTAEQRAAHEVATLIRKLRWVGMENEAKRLQRVLAEFPVDKRGSLLAGPHCTD
jgi:hypothetical protein